MKKRAVVLLSGGLDSAVTLFYAIRAGYACYALTVLYGQRHRKEVALARRLAGLAGAHFETVRLPFFWKGSSLVDRRQKLPRDRTVRQIAAGGVPSSYVPARNTVLLSIGVAYAEAIGARRVFIGAHEEDASGYPDCRRPYLETFNDVVRLGTKAGGAGKLAVSFPLIGKKKSRIITLGAKLGVPFAHTWSCYAGGKRPCMRCDSCVLRAKGFREAGLPDPLVRRDRCTA